MTLYYIPLESYRERYTFQMSAPRVGWFERKWREYGIHYRRIDGDTSDPEERIAHTLRTGQVLDAVGRSTYCFAQIEQLLSLAESKQLTNEDTIYFDDFWHPGIEALAYAFDQMRIRPKMYAFLWAQSVDEFDFTHKMRHWMRHFEIGIGKILNGIFVCCPTLADLVEFGGIAHQDKIHVVGLPFCTEEVLERMPGRNNNRPIPVRENKVVFSSRWDEEKHPDFFLQVAKRIIASEDITTKFVICTSAPKLRSNYDGLLTILNRQIREMKGRIVLKENLTKEEYYQELCSAKIQFNCADQDFVSFTLLEASVAGCYPIYPYFRSFPETFLGITQFMYERNHLSIAVDKVRAILQRTDLWSPELIESREWIHNRFDNTWSNMLHVMDIQSESKVIPSFQSPFAPSASTPSGAKIYL